MKYISTRGGAKEGVSAAYAIKNGLAEDGGLYMPTEIPHFGEGELEALLPLSYPERAAAIIGKFLTDYSKEELLEDANAAYSEEKFGASPAPVVSLGEGKYVLELWHGPTCAFKDMALQLMPRLFVRALRKTGEERRAMILVATSGDTGKAALEGYRDIPGTCIKVFYPTDGVSRVQKLQMQTQEGENVSVDAILGNFDDAQNGVKKIFTDSAIAESLNERGVFLSSANSINWGRLVPQIVYYASAYLDLVKCGEIKMGDSLDFSVPTGNFGNIFACYIAKRMGLPVGRLVCASNSNNVLTDFLKTGVYDKNRDFHTTMSPSMDILISSNLERLIYLTLGTEKCKRYMKALAECGRYELTEEDYRALTADFVGYYTDEDMTRATIRSAYKNKSCLIDTHTAVALFATEQYMSESKAGGAVVTVSTASPYKFAGDVYTSLTGNYAESLEALELLESLTGVPIPAPLKNLQSKEIKHSRIIKKEDMAQAVCDFSED